MICDAHCHFFSAGFFRALGREAGVNAGTDASESLPARLGWDAPGSNEALADRWVAELDRHGVARAMVIASVPGDEDSVAAAAARHPERLTGAFMFNPASPDADARLARALENPGLRTVCLFPAMHHVPLDDPRTTSAFAAAARHGRAVFVHCGLLSVGVRKKLQLPSRFDLRLGDPLAVAAVAVRYPSVPVIVPHLGAGLLREALMAAMSAPNVMLDTSSSNDWIRLHPGLTLRDALARALDCVGPGRLLFGTDSSFFPRGWQRAIYEAQLAIWTDLGLDPAAQALIFGGNFQRTVTGTGLFSTETR
jgi:predicted TIM-barrel fold metal-dependent hydrolase